MKNPLRRYALGAMAVGMLAGGGAVALSESAPAWRPMTYGLTAAPGQLLPTTVSPTHPVRVVSTAVDGTGRPVVSVRTATDRATAEVYVRSGQRAPNAVGVEVDAPMTALGTDTYRGQQWGLAKTRVVDAWKDSTGNGVTVAVIDTGVNAGHPDLAGQVLPGKDYVNGTEGTSVDPNGHGTHVAGTIAALTGNDVGVSGVAPGVKILPIRVLDANGAGQMSDAAAGIIYAADQGADIINLSFGSTSKVWAVSSAIDYARRQGAVVVAAAGNSRAKLSPVTYPAADAGVIAVAATDSADQIAGYSNQGAYVDVAAPGNDIISASTGTGYGTRFGTSMASAHVSGVAALVRGRQPGLTADEVEDAIEQYATDRGTKGWDRDFGYGRVDAVDALAAADMLAATPNPGGTATTSPSATSSTAPTASSSPTVAKIRPLVTVAMTSSPALYGSTTTTTFTVLGAGRAWPSRPAQICVAEPGDSFKCTDTTTSDLGKVIVTRPATGSYQILLAVNATDTSESVSSTVASYVVRTQLSVLRSAPGTLTIGLTGAVGQVVQVQRFDKNRWVTATAYRAAPTRVVAKLTVGQRYRVVVPDTTAVVGATSPVVTA